MPFFKIERNMYTISAFYRWKLVFLPIPFVEADIIVESVVDYALYRITILN